MLQLLLNNSQCTAYRHLVGINHLSKSYLSSDSFGGQGNSTLFFSLLQICYLPM